MVHYEMMRFLGKIVDFVFFNVSYNGGALFHFISFMCLLSNLCVVFFSSDVATVDQSNIVTGSVLNRKILQIMYYVQDVVGQVTWLQTAFRLSTCILT